MGRVHWVYALTEPETDEVRYVGVTADLFVRYKSHVYLKHGRGFNKELVAWIQSLVATGGAPGLRTLERTKTPNSCEAKWIKAMKAAGCRLFNSVHFHEPKSGQAAFLESSIAGQIRTALDQLGLDAPAIEIQDLIGPQPHSFNGHNTEFRDGEWRTVHPRQPFPVPLSYINKTRNDYKRFLAMASR